MDLYSLKCSQYSLCVVCLFLQTNYFKSICLQECLTEQVCGALRMLQTFCFKTGSWYLENFRALGVPSGSLFAQSPLQFFFFKWLRCLLTSFGISFCHMKDSQQKLTTRIVLKLTKLLNKNHTHLYQSLSCFMLGKKIQLNCQVLFKVILANTDLEFILSWPLQMKSTHLYSSGLSYVSCTYRK